MVARNKAQRATSRKRKVFHPKKLAKREGRKNGASPTLFTQKKRGVRAKAFWADRKELFKKIQKHNSSKEPFGQPETHVALRQRK